MSAKNNTYTVKVLQDVDLQTLSYMCRGIWNSIGKWKEPCLQDSLMFAQTELGEAFDAYLRTFGNDGFVRNNAKDVGTQDLATELWDTIFMCMVALDQLEVNVADVAEKKLSEMSSKRGVDVKWEYQRQI